MQARAAAAALDRAAEEGEGVLLTIVVLAEAAYVLTKTYGVERRAAARGLRELTEHPAVLVPEIDLAHESLSLWLETSLDFADAYLAALARRRPDPRVLSFDRDFDAVPGVERVEPG